MLWCPEELAAHAEGGRSSLTSGWIICAMTGCLCLSCMICVTARMNASGSLTSALASASGLSNTIAMSISPPSFLMRAVLPFCMQAYAPRCCSTVFPHVSPIALTCSRMAQEMHAQCAGLTVFRGLSRLLTSFYRLSAVSPKVIV